MTVQHFQDNLSSFCHLNLALGSKFLPQTLPIYTQAHPLAFRECACTLCILLLTTSSFEFVFMAQTSQTEVCGKYLPPHILFFLEIVHKCLNTATDHTHVFTFKSASFYMLVQAHAPTLIIRMTQSITFVILTVYVLPFVTLRIYRMINWQPSPCYIHLCTIIGNLRHVIYTYAQ